MLLNCFIYILIQALFISDVVMSWIKKHSLDCNFVAILLFKRSVGECIFSSFFFIIYDVDLGLKI